MPTATSLSGYSIFNNGPLTTTFTALASCSTAYETMVGLAGTPSAIEWAVPAGTACGNIAPTDCNPNGAVIQSIDSSAMGANPTAAQIIVYHSPGLICPSGWVTVGGAAKINPTSTSISGAFNSSMALPTTAPAELFLPQLDVVLAALDPGETAAVCCPSSYTTIGGGCYSALPSSVFTPSAGCEELIPPDDLETTSGTFTIGLQTLTGEMGTITATIPLTTITTTFQEPSSMVGVAFLDMFILVHKTTDTASGGGSSTATNKPNSAARVGGHERGLGVVATVCCVAFALGVLLVV